MPHHLFDLHEVSTGVSGELLEGGAFADVLGPAGQRHVHGLHLHSLLRLDIPRQPHSH